MLSLIRITGGLLGALTLGAASFAPPALAQESADPIKLTLHDWTGQLITTELMGEILKKAGYSVEYVQADYLAQFAGLESGDLHVGQRRLRRHRQFAAATNRLDQQATVGRTGLQGGAGIASLEERRERIDA